MSLRLGSASKKAVDALGSQGFLMWGKPEVEIPDLPADVTSLSDEDLMLLFSCYTSWSDYINGQVAAAQIDERALEKKVSRLQNLMLVRTTPAAGKTTVTALKAEISVDPAVVELEDLVEEAYAYRKIIENMAENLERDTALVSRELTRRTNDFKSRRKDKWTT